jgi:hypothetical protein
MTICLSIPAAHAKVQNFETIGWTRFWGARRAKIREAPLPAPTVGPRLWAKPQSQRMGLVARRLTFGRAAADEVAQTFLSAGFGDFPVPSLQENRAPRNWKVP